MAHWQKKDVGSRERVLQPAIDKVSCRVQACSSLPRAPSSHCPVSSLPPTPTELAQEPRPVWFSVVENLNLDYP